MDLELMDYFPLLVARLHFFFFKKNIKCASDCKSKKMTFSLTGHFAGVWRSQILCLLTLET